jgi:hypothetical protein
MKVLFLDVDGVLNSNHRDLDMSILQRLATVLDATGCKIVVSSTWRKSDKHMDLLKKTLALIGHPEVIIDCTPVADVRISSGLWTSITRGAEIQMWLDAHPEVLQFAIADDDSDMGHLIWHLILVDGTKGLTDDDAANLIAKLNTPTQVEHHTPRDMRNFYSWMHWVLYGLGALGLVLFLSVRSPAITAALTPFLSGVFTTWIVLKLDSWLRYKAGK